MGPSGRQSISASARNDTASRHAALARFTFATVSICKRFARPRAIATPAVPELETEARGWGKA